MTLTFLTFDSNTEETDEVSFEVVNIERDSPDFLTLYGEELNGRTPYVVLDQEILEKLNRVDDAVEPPPSKKEERRYFCPCCGSDNTRVASIDKVVDPDDASNSWKGVSIFCGNCPNPINIVVEVSNTFEPANAPYSVMNPLRKWLKNPEK